MSSNTTDQVQDQLQQEAAKRGLSAPSSSSDGYLPQQQINPSPKPASGAGADVHVHIIDEEADRRKEEQQERAEMKEAAHEIGRRLIEKAAEKKEEVESLITGEKTTSQQVKEALTSAFSAVAEKVSEKKEETVTQLKEADQEFRQTQKDSLQGS
eukprot:TRINITY_DN4138_c0_g1_i1.p1 TRINITY_DN4138_c0_g1~~TRINITY_DN4138_c0_g1_i1.p1  ORF type:complete len:166 (-),score=74.83 TRINITY_DN4138_c0_g1_i1:161-625(-)